MSTVEVMQSNFDELLNKNEIVVLDFWAAWCGPCRAFAPTFEKVASQNPGIIFGKVDTEAQPNLSASFNIRSIPTLMVFKQNILVFSQPGALPEAALKDIVQQIKELDMDKVRAEIEKEEQEENKS